MGVRATSALLAGILALLPAAGLGAQPDCRGSIERAEMKLREGLPEEARGLVESCCDSLESSERYDCLRVLLASLTLLREHRLAVKTAEAMIEQEPSTALQPGTVPARARALHDSLRAALVGGVSVVSTPNGAFVTFDGDSLGVTTPWMGYAIRGNHEVRLSKQGYKDAVLTVDVVAGVLEPLRATLIRGPGGQPGLDRAELWRSSVLPGWGQIRAGRRRGWAYTAGVISAGVASTLAYGNYTSAVDDYDTAVAQRDRSGAVSAYDDAKKARSAWLTWAGIAAGIYALNVIDAWLF
jgi:hypothetical protein